MRGRVARVRTTDPTCEITRRRPVVDLHGVDLEILYGQIAVIDIDEQHARRLVDGARKRGLAHTGRAEDQEFDPAGIPEPLIRRDDFHSGSSFCAGS